MTDSWRLEMYFTFSLLDSAFGGLGGCPFVPRAAGSISSEGVIHMRDESAIKTGVDMTMVMAVFRHLRELLAKNEG